MCFHDKTVTSGRVKSKRAKNEFALEALEPRVLLSSNALLAAGGACSNTQGPYDSVEVSLETSQAAFDASISPAGPLDDIFGDVSDDSDAPVVAQTPESEDDAASPATASHQEASERQEGTSESCASPASPTEPNEPAATSSQTDAANPATQQLTETLRAANGPPAEQASTLT